MSRLSRSFEEVAVGRGAWCICIWACVLWTVALVGCGDVAPRDELSAPVPSPPTRAATAQTPLPDDAATAPLKRKIKFKKGGGESAFSLKPEADGAKLVDAKEEELARFVLSDSKLKVKNANDTVLGYVVASPGRYKIKNAAQDVELWRLQRQDDNDWKLEDGQEKLVYKIKHRDYGFEIEDAAENSLFRVKFKEGKTSVRDAADKTVWYTKDPIAASAVTCLAMEAIDSLPLRSALMTMLILHETR